MHLLTLVQLKVISRSPKSLAVTGRVIPSVTTTDNKNGIIEEEIQDRDELESFCGTHGLLIAYIL